MFFKRKNHNNKSKKLPRLVHDHMECKFDLLPEYLDMLRCFEYEAVVNGRQVRCIRIFSPDKVRGYHLSIKTHLDLEQHPEMLLYEGYIDGCSSVYVADCRPASRKVKAR